MTQQPADGGRPLPEDIADLVCCWVIDFLNVNGLEYWEEGPCVASMYKRMAPFLTHQAKSDAALAAAAEQLRAVMDALKESQAENARLEEIIASYSRASILNRKELKLANERLAAADSVLHEIVCTEPPDDGVVLLSNESTCHLNTEHNCQEYDHVHFSPLGDALMKLYRTLKGELPPGLELVRIGCREENHRLKKEVEGLSRRLAEAGWLPNPKEADRDNQRSN